MLCSVSMNHCASFHEARQAQAPAVTLSAPGLGAGSQKGVSVQGTQLWEPLVLQAEPVHQDAPFNLAVICLTTGIRSVEQLDSNNPLRYPISTSVPNTLNYSQGFGYKTSVIPVLVIIIHTAVKVALSRNTCFGLH